MTRSPRIPLADSIIYEMHVKGFSKLNQRIREDLRGTYAGLASPPALKYLKQLGITAVELMPVHQFIHDKLLVDRGLRNYWGYNTLNYFSPEVALLLLRRHAARRSRNSRRWSRPCTARASRSSSTWSTTTPPRAISSAPC